MATHSSILAWEIPWTKEPRAYRPWSHKRVRCNLVTQQQQIQYSDSHFKYYSQLIVNVKYWLYFPCCAIHPCSLFYT